MTSKARQSFDANVQDVERLLQIHSQNGGTGKGRRYGLEVLNKSAIVLITAFWEAFCEDLAAEGLEHLVREASSADALPIALKKQIAKELKEKINQISVWEISDDKWRGYLIRRLADLQIQRNLNLNTPKSAQLDELFENAVGIERISGAWTLSTKTSPIQARKKLDDFVTLRGNVAHRGVHGDGVKRKDVVDYFKLVRSLADKTGEKVNSHVEEITGKRLF
jgi:hypothetical protein